MIKEMCREHGSRVYPLTRDHKPADELEQKRISAAGGEIYQTAAPVSKSEMIIGPYRVLPGRLSVSRTFGDVEAKVEKYGGNPKVVIPTPDIKSFKITKDHDFIIMGCDGIFDKLNNKEAVQCIWDSIRDNLVLNIHYQCGVGIETILKNSLMRRSLDNVTALIIAFEGFNEAVFSNDKNEIRTRAVKITRTRTAGLSSAQRTQEKTRNSEGTKIVLKRSMPSSTKTAPRKHFDFSKANVEMMEKKALNKQ
jgi:protein phosphatase 2C family protein 2/3